MTELKSFLSSHFSNFKTAPFLFIGSGISIRYLGLENWEGLLKKFSALTDKPYEYFVTAGNGHLPKIATAIALEYQQIWWKDKRFAPNRVKYKEHAKNIGSALKIEISDYLTKASENYQKEESLENEIRLLSTCVIDGVITTNWDAFLELIFPTFKPYVGQDNLLFSTIQSLGEIYKIHGCCSQPNSLVLTQEDYETFTERNPYLAAKLLTIFVEHPIVFLGYSLNDENIIQIVTSIAKCLTTANIDRLRDRLIFVQYNSTATESRITNSNLVSGANIIPVIQIETANLSDVYEVLSGIKRKFSASLLRKLKEHVFELVKDTDAKTRIYVQDIDDDTDFSEIDVVFGVGKIAEQQPETSTASQVFSTVGYKGLTRFHLYDDILRSSTELNSKDVVSETLPILLKQTKVIPVFKYLREGDYLNDRGELKVPTPSVKLNEKINTKSRDFYPPKTYRAKEELIKKEYLSFSHLIERFSIIEALNYFPFVEETYMDSKTLLKFLVDNRKIFELPIGNQAKYQYVKIVCLLDWIKYKKKDVAISFSIRKNTP